MRAQGNDDTRAFLAELPAHDWEVPARLPDADDRTISQMATRLLRRALLDVVSVERERGMQQWSA